MTEDEMVGRHHRLDGHGFGWTPGVGDGQGGLACCDSWGHKESDTTEQLNLLTVKPAFFILPFHLHQEALQFIFTFCCKGGVICISEVIGISLAILIPACARIQGHTNSRDQKLMIQAGVTLQREGMPQVMNARERSKIMGMSKLQQCFITAKP